MRISLAQIDVVNGSPEKNSNKICSYIRKASEEKANLVVFPEMSDTGYDMPTILEKASSWDVGVVPAIRMAAKEHRIHVIAGVSEKADSEVYNAIIVINKDGEIVCKYRKTHLITAAPMHEEKYLGFGNELVIVELDSLKIGLMTCYEIRFPEVARKLALNGAQLLLMPAAFPLLRLPHWECLTSARAIENQVFVGAISRIGSDFKDSLTFCGSSRIIDPYGTILSSASQIEEKLITCEIDLNMMNQVRNQIKVHQDIRNDLYEKPIRFY